jgi:predicted nucleic acid-binding protein
MPTRFLDTSLLIRYFTRDDPEKADRVLALLQRVEAGQERVAISPLVVFECVFVLQHTYRLPRQTISEALEDVISLRGMQIPDKALYYRAFDVYVNTNISFADAYNSTYMASLNLTEIYSFDEDSDSLPGIIRVEPDD